MTLRRHVSLWAMLLWAYQRQRVIEETGRDLGDAAAEAAQRTTARHTSTDGCARVARIALFGTEIDGAGPTALSARCHPDAEALHRAVERLPESYARVIVTAARTGSQPQPCHAVPRYRPVPNRSEHGGSRHHCLCEHWVEVPRPPLTGREQGHVGNDGRFVRYAGRIYNIEGRTARLLATYCPVELYPDPAMVARRNTEAVLFNEAMTMLDALVNRMVFKDHIVGRQGEERAA